MTIPPELEAQILRYYHAEKWRIGTIATQLNVHHSAVSRVLSQAGLPPLGALRRASAIDPYLPFILETLEKFPTLTASRLYAMVTAIGRGAGIYIIPAPLPHGECGVWGRAPIIKQGFFATIFTRITTAANSVVYFGWVYPLHPYYTYKGIASTLPCWV